MTPDAFDNPLHLALGDSAAGCVRAACALISPGVAQAVMNIPDDLSHGPLGDGIARAEYMRECYRAYGEWVEHNATDAFAPWLKLIERLHRDRHDAVVLWAGENVSEATFLAMACARLALRPEPIVHVAVPGKHGRNCVAVHAPEELSAFFASRRTLSGAERAALARDFTRIQDETGLLRCWQHGRVIGVAVDHYDGLLLKACTRHGHWHGSLRSGQLVERSILQNPAPGFDRQRPDPGRWAAKLDPLLRRPPHYSSRS